jgi:superfamily II DNA or RNA helicase
MLSKSPRKWQAAGLRKLAVVTPNYKSARRGFVFAPPGTGKSYFAALLVKQALNYAGTIVIGYTFSYLESEFAQALDEVGITDISVYSATSGRAFNPECRVQLVSLQTLDSRGVESFSQTVINTLILDEAHTALNYKSAVAAITKLRIGRVIGMTGTYFNGTLLTDEGRAHGEWLSRCEPGLLVTAGTHEDMVSQGILRPIQYFRLKQADVDHYSPITAAETIALWKRHNPTMDRSWFFVSRRDEKRSQVDPIDMYRDLLIAEGVEPLVLSGKSTDEEIAFARANPDRVFLSVDYGATGWNNPRCHTVVLCSGHTGSANRLGQKIGRANRATKNEPNVITTVIDSGCNFALDGMRGHPILEDSIRELVEHPERLFTHAVNGVTVEQPTVLERSPKGKAASGGEYGVTLSEQVIQRYARGGVDGVRALHRLLVEDGNPSPIVTLGMLLTDQGINIEPYRAYLVS